MKNIHILPTDQPSRLAFDMDENFYLLCEEPVFFKHQELVENRNIYITSSEEIKEGDWYLDTFKNEIRKAQLNLSNDKYKKIILSTDPTLIADGVQAIDDEFLKWFVKNPTCEFVEVDKNWNYPLDKSWEYKIIIPQDEPKQEQQKQHLINVMHDDEELGLYEEPKQETKCYCGHTTYCDCGPLEEPKQIYYNTVGRENGKFVIKGQFNTQKEALDLANELNKKFPDLYYDWNETLIKEEKQD